MKRTLGIGVAAVALAIALITLTTQAQPGAPGSAPLLAQAPAPTVPDTTEADRAAIVKSSVEFTEAFNKGDAKAVAAMWTTRGESRSADGSTLVGRDAIEKAYGELFQASAGGKIEVLVKSIRFPAKDMAVEEGLLRQTFGAKGLPTTTTYVAVHSREGGQWKIALSSEAGVGQDRLEDLEWLLGSWTTKVKDDDVKFTFAKDAKKPFLAGTFTKTAAGKEPKTGSIRIAFDPELGQIRSWGFEEDGGHSQALWANDGKSWLIEWRGVLADGTPVSEVIVLVRVGADAITWRSTDRTLGDERLPDTKPMRLTRTK